MPLILLNLNDREGTEIHLNSDQILMMRRYDSYTFIRTTGMGDGKPFSLNVTQHPDAILGRIKEPVT